MNPDPNSVIDLDVDKMLVSRESTRAFDMIISDTFLLAAISTKYSKFYFALVGLLLFLFKCI